MKNKTYFLEIKQEIVFKSFYLDFKQDFSPRFKEMDRAMTLIWVSEEVDERFAAKNFV